jgi:hypothetical protein
VCGQDSPTGKRELRAERSFPPGFAYPAGASSPTSRGSVEGQGPPCPSVRPLAHRRASGSLPLHPAGASSPTSRGSVEGQGPPCPSARPLALQRASGSLPLHPAEASSPTSRGSVEGQAPACPSVRPLIHRRASGSLPLHPAEASSPTSRGSVEGQGPPCPRVRPSSLGGQAGASRGTQFPSRLRLPERCVLGSYPAACMMSHQVAKGIDR